MDLRAYTWGIMTGIVMWFAVLGGVSYTLGIRWQPVQVEAR